MQPVGDNEPSNKDISIVYDQELDALTLRSKSLSIDSRADEEAEEMGDGEVESATVHCATCGHGLTVRNGNIFNKLETLPSFSNRASRFRSYPTHGEMFQQV